VTSICEELPRKYPDLFKEKMAFADRFLAIVYYGQELQPPRNIIEKTRWRFARGPPHQYMYDYELLSTMLHDSGFKYVWRRSYRVGEVPDIDKLDAHPLESLYVEAKKV